MSLFNVDEPAKLPEPQKKVENKSKKPAKIKEIKQDEEEIKNLKPLQQIKSFKAVEENIVSQFKNNKLHHAIMLSGKYGIGKATFAYWLISRLILSTCENKDNKEELTQMHLEMLNRNIHPDVFFLELQENENEIKIEQIRSFIEKISLKSTYGNKFIIIDDINSINKNGINALLKTLEEPPENTYFFIINHQNSVLLDTIYSRCNEIKLKLSKNDCMQILQNQNENLTFDEIEFYTTVSNNSIKLANILIDLDIKTTLQQPQKTATLLNIIYKSIEVKYKQLSRTIKMSVLENIITYLIHQKIINDENDNVKNNIIENNSILKQFYNMKTFELPVLFI